MIQILKFLISLSNLQMKVQERFRSYDEKIVEINWWNLAFLTIIQGS